MGILTEALVSSPYCIRVIITGIVVIGITFYIRNSKYWIPNMEKYDGSSEPLILAAILIFAVCFLLIWGPLLPL